MWPIKGGEAADRTSGVIAAVKGGKGTIGYADASQAGDLAMRQIKVGERVRRAVRRGRRQGRRGLPAVEGRPEVDMAIDVDRTTTEAGAYPIVLVSYLIACQTYDDADEADLVKGFLSYVVSEDGPAGGSRQRRLRPARRRARRAGQDIVDEIAAK